MRRRTLGAVLAALAVTAAAQAHEERLVIGRVERLDAAKRLLVVQDPERGRSMEITVDPETEVRRCRVERGLAALRPGATVRVKYLDRGATTFDTLSVLVLPDGQGR